MRIVYIDIDTQNVDHLGCYGYHRPTSPVIDALAAEGVRYSRYYTSDAPCLPSRTALYSGRFGIQTGVVNHSGSAAEPRRQGIPQRGFRDLFDECGLARQLQDCGLHTTLISPFGQRHAAHWIYAGFNEIHNTGLGGMESAEQIMPVLQKWVVDNAGSDNWFLHVNFWDPHTPYRVPLEYGEPFAGYPLPDWLDDDALIARHTKMTGPHTALDLGMFHDADDVTYPRTVKRIDSRAAMRKWIDGYNTGTRYADQQVGWLVDELKRLGVYDETAIIVSSDHGENQGELGIYGEHATADQATCRIPLVIKWPGCRAGAVDDGLHYNLDLAPTLMDLLGGRSPEIWDGLSFAGTMLPATGPDAGREDLVLSQCAHVLQRSVRWDNWLYLRTYHCGFHLFPDEMLIDLVHDPHEQHNLAGQHPELCREGAWRLTRWHDAQMHHMTRWCSDVQDPLWVAMREGGPSHAMHAGPATWVKLPQYIERLEQTGRSDGAEALRRRYARYLP